MGGILLIVERGNPIGSHITRSARKYLLDKYNPNQPETTPGGTDSFSGKNDPNSSKNSTSFLPPLPGVSPEDIIASVVAPCTHDKVTHLFINF